MKIVKVGAFKNEVHLKTFIVTYLLLKLSDSLQSSVNNVLNDIQPPPPYLAPYQYQQYPQYLFQQELPPPQYVPQLLPQYQEYLQPPPPQYQQQEPPPQYQQEPELLEELQEFIEAELQNYLDADADADVEQPKVNEQSEIVDLTLDEDDDDDDDIIIL